MEWMYLCSILKYLLLFFYCNLSSTIPFILPPGLLIGVDDMNVSIYCLNNHIENMSEKEEDHLYKNVEKILITMYMNTLRGSLSSLRGK
jgi:hypothetical protein